MAALPTVGGSAGVWGSELTTWLLVGHNSDGSVTLDSVASDVQPLGTRAAGSAGLPADSGHVHAMPTLDQVGQPAGNIAMNSKKFTGMANGTASTDSATVGQIPAIDTTASDVQPPGISAAAGSSGKAADARHVHPVTGAIGNAVASKTASYSVQSSDGTLLCNASGGAFTVTLPTAAGITGQIFRVKKTDTSGNAITVATTSAQTIDSVSAKKLSTAMSEMTVQSDGANWWLVISPAPVKTYNVKHYGAIGDGTVDDTAAFNACISAITGTAAPATNSRLAAGVMYIPGGTYKVTSDLVIRSVQNFVIRGDGAGQTSIKASGTGFTTAVLLIDGALDSVFEGFQVTGDGTEQVTDAIRLDWTTAALRSTTGNSFRDIRIRALKFVVGLSLECNGSRQLDGTVLQNIVIDGGQVAGSWSSSGNWQKGIAFGNGTFGNAYDQGLYRVDVAQCYYGMHCNASGFGLYSAQMLGNAVDFFIIPWGQITISNVQSQNSGTFISQTSTFNPSPISVSDVFFISATTASPYYLMTLCGGTWNISNVTAYITNGGSYVNPVIQVLGAGSGKPGVVTFNNIALYNPLTSGIVPTSGEAQIFVMNYANYNPNTGVYSVTNAEFYDGVAWAPIGGVTPPDIQYFSAVGTATWNKPAGAVTTEVFVLSGGAGAGSGRRGAAGTVRCGGGGGGGAMLVSRKFVTADLSSSVTVTIGDGGLGGNAVTADDTSGNNGSNGGSSSFGSYLAGPLASAGSGGTATTGTGGGNPFGGVGGPGAGGSASTSGGNGVSINPGAAGAAGGPAGGGITTGNAAGAGAAGNYSYLGGNSSSTFGTAGVVDTTTPASGTSSGIRGTPGGSPGSGAASITTAAQAGASAYANSGAGGAGGGASLDGNNSGAGGKGGSGLILVVSYFQ